MVTGRTLALGSLKWQLPGYCLAGHRNGDGQVVDPCVIEKATGRSATRQVIESATTGVVTHGSLKQ